MKKLFLSSCVLAVMLSACSEKTEEENRTGGPDSINQSPENKAAAGQSVFTAQCQLCHGADGKLGASGAKDLSVSTLSHKDAVNVVSYGRGGMMAYKDLLTREQIENVVSYIETLRQK